MRHVVQTVVVELHEGLVVVLFEGLQFRTVIPAVELSVVALDIASPLVSDVRLELGRLGSAWSVGHEDASAERKWVPWVVLFHEGSEEVRKGFLVDVG